MRAGLVHRDLKPDNVFLTRSGVTKILDFGIAKLAQDPAVADGLATLTGVVLGTAGYLAPEQIRGDAVDARTDLFALGSMLFEMSQASARFAREHTIDTLHAILHDEPPDLLPPGAAADAIVRRLLEKAPAASFQSAADLLWALEQIDATKARCRRGRWRRGAGAQHAERLGDRGAAGLSQVTLVLVVIGAGGRATGARLTGRPRPHTVRLVAARRSRSSTRGRRLP